MSFISPFSKLGKMNDKKGDGFEILVLMNFQYFSPLILKVCNHIQAPLNNTTLATQFLLGFMFQEIIFHSKNTRESSRHFLIFQENFPSNVI